MEIKKDTKQHILETAFLLFLRNSYKAVTLKEIIRETGLSNGAFYHHFESKESLFKEIIDTYLLRIARQIYEYYPKDSLWNFIQDTLADAEKILNKLEPILLKEGGGINFLTFMFESYRLFPDTQSELNKLHKLEFAAWVEMIDIAKTKGEIRAELPAELIARMFIYLPDGAYMDFLIDENLEKYRFAHRRLWEGLYNTLKT
ncbi:MAG: TetR/AcrR family transcriptional regulator [Prevotellaceae bacterium]|jgi:AcrR family transcriptional regulator|nr:TetR/AcrR family transcriptional regulator [Prevotellaceae bacterium]